MERLAYLKQLPFSIDLTLSGKIFRLFHASAQSVFHRVKREASKKERLAMFENTEMTGVPDRWETAGYSRLWGYSYPLYLTNNQRTHRKNASVEASDEQRADAVQCRKCWNVPYDGIPQACYCVVEGETGSCGSSWVCASNSYVCPMISNELYRWRTRCRCRIVNGTSWRLRQGWCINEGIRQ